MHASFLHICIRYHVLTVFHFSGIGIDDTFVMLAAWRRTSVKLDVPERMGQMMSEAAVSITITSLTNIISFSLGLNSPFQSVRIFCTYSALAVLFTFVWHITFFAGCMAVSGYREYKNLHSIFCCELIPESVAINGKYLFFIYFLLLLFLMRQTHARNYAFKSLLHGPQMRACKG